MIRLPYPNKDKIDNSDSHRELQRISEIRYKNWYHHRYRKQKIINQMAQHIRRMKIRPITIILIMLKLLIFRFWNSFSLSFSHPILRVILKRIAHFITVNHCGAKNYQDVENERLGFYLFQLLHLGLKGLWNKWYALEKTQQVEHHDIRKYEMVVNPLRFSLKLCIPILFLLLFCFQVIITRTILSYQWHNICD